MESALAESLAAEIAAFVATSPLNRLPVDGGPMFEAPLVGFAAGDDPLFGRYKEIIGPFHWTPREALGARGDENVSVVSYILPISRATRRSNRGPSEPSRAWSHTRHHGEAFNDAVRRHIVAYLHRLGYRAVAPAIRADFAWRETPGGPASPWSERHVAYAAGLGTFGLCDGLITARGKAMRCGSVVTTAPLPPSPRPYDHYRAYCLSHPHGGCGRCAARCPGGAITREGGHDRRKCQAYQRTFAERLKAEYQVDVVGCGLCQVGVPCEGRIPRRN